MIEFKTGDIFAEDVEALVNSVNCVGVMGRGVALQFKNMFPENFRAYRTACKRGDVRPGSMFIYEQPSLVNPRYVINFPTKRHWRSKSRLADVLSGLDALAREVTERGINSIAIPPLATGLGGLRWDQVRPAIEDALADLDSVRVVVFEPGSVPADGRPNRSKEVPPMTPASAVLIGLIRRYLHGLLDPFVTLLEIHKLMYFMQETGQLLDLDYQKAPHGPYSPDLRFLMRRLEGHYLMGYRDGGDHPDKEIELVPGAFEEAEAFLPSVPETRERLHRVSSLVEGFESPFGLELLATVHWVTSREDAITTDEIVDRTYKWGNQKHKFTERQIRIATDALRLNEWIRPEGLSVEPVAAEKLTRIHRESMEQPQLFDF